MMDDASEMGHMLLQFRLSSVRGEKKREKTQAHMRKEKKEALMDDLWKCINRANASRASSSSSLFLCLDQRERKNEEYRARGNAPAMITSGVRHV